MAAEITDMRINYIHALKYKNVEEERDYLKNNNIALSREADTYYKKWEEAVLELNDYKEKLNEKTKEINNLSNLKVLGFMKWKKANNK